MPERAQGGIVDRIGDGGVAAAVAGHALVQPLLAGIAGCHHHMPRTHGRALFGMQVDAARGGLEALHPGAVKHAGPTLAQPRQQARGHAVGVDPRSLVAEDGQRRLDPIHRLQRVRRQQLDLETMPEPQLEFLLQHPGVAPLAGEVQAVHPGEVHVADIAGLVLQHQQALGAGPVGQHGIVLAILPGQVDHVGVDLVLQQGGAS